MSSLYKLAATMRWPLALAAAAVVAVSADISVKTHTDGSKNYLEVSGIECDDKGALDAQINLGMLLLQSTVPRCL